MRNEFTKTKRFLCFNSGLLTIFFQVQLAVAQSALLDPLSQGKFVNPLPVPTTINGRAGGTLTLSVSQFDQYLGLKDPVTGEHMTTKVWGYNGSFPGPTILSRKNVPLQIFWLNNLYNTSTLQPLPHLLPIDETVDWAFSGINNWQQYGIPIVTHVHGGHTESVSDGSPEAWYTPFFTKKGKTFQKGQTEPYYYQNDQDAATLWYHDHTFGITRLNVYAGLAGYYLLTDDNEQQLKADRILPADTYDLGLAIQDRMFTANGQLFYPSRAETEAFPAPTILPEFFGNFILVNGMLWPLLEVEPRQYRFRILNGSDSRFYNLFLSSGSPFRQIGTDQGLLPHPVSLDQMVIAPGQRKDVIIDFSDPALSGQTIIMRNNARSPYPKGTPADPNTSGQIMAFRVNQPLNKKIPLTAIPGTLGTPINSLVQNGPTRQLILFETEDEFGRIKPILGTATNGGMAFTDPITENIQLNDTEVWEIYNATEDAHPIHLHLVKFQALSRQKYFATIDQQTGRLSNIRLVGQPHNNNANENGWKDTEIMLPGEVTRIIAKFDLPGLYEWHCHILSHEDHEMMRPFYVSAPAITAKINTAATPALVNNIQITNAPNPFSSITQLQFSIALRSHVSVSVYDIQGRKIQEIFNGIKEPGRQQIIINGSEWKNGIYFCEITINMHKQLYKLVLQKR